MIVQSHAYTAPKIEPIIPVTKPAIAIPFFVELLIDSVAKIIAKIPNTKDKYPVTQNTILKIPKTIAVIPCPFPILFFPPF